MDNKFADSSGESIDVYDTHKIKKYIRDNIWNILGIGVGAWITLIGFVNILVSTNYAMACSEYYGIDAKYFADSSVFQGKIICLALIIFLLLLPFLLNYINSKLKSKVFLAMSFIIMVFTLFMQNILYTAGIINSIKSEWLISMIDNLATIIVFLISDIVLAYVFILRNHVRKNKNMVRWEIIVFLSAFIIFSIDVSIGASVIFNNDISDKRFYEVIDDDKVVITNYEGKFLVMDCDVEGETLYIEKGKYSFIEMTDVDIKYKNTRMCSVYDTLKGIDSCWRIKYNMESDEKSVKTFDCCYKNMYKQ